MLKGFDEDLASLDLPDDVKTKLIESANTRAQGLVNKNEELLGKLTNKDEGTASSQAELAALKQFKSNAEIKAAEDAQNWEQATKLKEEAHKLELQSYAEKTTANEKLIETLLIDNGLSSELDTISVNPLLKETVTAYFRSQSKIVDGKAMVGEKSLSDAVKEWAVTDAGKASCLAQANSGGDGKGGSGPTGAKKLSDLTLTQQAQLANTNPAEYERLKGN